MRLWQVLKLRHSKLKEIGIRVLDLNQAGDLRIYIDGADEVTRHGHMIKGGGGALTREKIVAEASDQFICIVDETKVVNVLGDYPLPVEVIPMAQSLVARQVCQAWAEYRRFEVISQRITAT